MIELEGNDSKKEEWEEDYERHLATVKMVEKAQNPEQLYDQAYLDTMRRQFFMLGWHARPTTSEGAAPAALPTPGQRPRLWDQGAGSGGRTAPTDPRVTLKAPNPGEPVTQIRYMQIGEEGWVEPFALIEHEASQTFGIDMKFDFVSEKDARHTVQVKRLAFDRFTGSGPDGCRIFRQALPPDMPRVQYQKVVEPPDQ